jgi:hypothetical protein
VATHRCFRQREQFGRDQEALMDVYSSRREFLSMLQQTEPPDKCQHLLRVAGSVNDDAQQAWAMLWSELKPQAAPSGAAAPGLAKGFVPACGWPEFLERFWLLKHYLDSMHRICHEKS